MSDLIYGIELLTTGVFTGLMYSMVALGFVVIFKASSVFNYAQGAMTLFAALTVVGLMPHVGLFASLVIDALVMCVVAVGAERVVFRPLMGSSPLTIFMGTVGFASILEGAAQIVWGTKPQGLKLDIPVEPLKFGEILLSRQDLFAAAVAGVFVAALAWFFRRT